MIYINFQNLITLLILTFMTWKCAQIVQNPSKYFGTNSQSLKTILKFQWYLNFWSLQFPHLELCKANFDLENIKQSWLSGQNIGLYAPSPWFKPQQPLPKKNKYFYALKGSILFAFLKLYNVVKVIKSQLLVKSCKITTFQKNMYQAIIR